MKKTSLLLITGIFAVGMVVSTPPRAEDHVVRVSADPWAPWAFGEEGGAASGGMSVEASKELFRRIGLEVEVNIYPYKRCLDQMKTGERDVFPMIKKTPEREEIMLFSDVAAREPQLIYFATGRMAGFDWKDWADLKDRTVGIVQGFNYGEFVPAAAKYGIRTEEVAGDEQNIKKLLANRVDLIIATPSTVNYYLQQNPEFQGRIEAASRAVTVAEFRFGLSKNGKAASHLSRINEAIREMQADGTLDRIMWALK